MNGMPDVVSIWGQPSFLDEVLEAGVLVELNEVDYAGYKFISGSLDGFKKDGKLYGLPRNTDVMAFYYHEEMFAENGWQVPVAMDGGDGWPMAIYLTDLLVITTGGASGECRSVPGWI